MGTATQTLQDAAKAARKHVYRERMESKYNIDAVQEEVLVDNEGAFFEFLERNFTKLDEEFEDNAAFTAHLYKLFFLVL